MRGHGFAVPASMPAPVQHTPHLSPPPRRLASPPDRERPPHAGVSCWVRGDASWPTLLPVHFPGVPSPGERSPRQMRANRCSGHHTRPAPRSQSAQYTSPPRRRGRPVRLRHCSRSSWPIRRCNVRESRRRRNPLSPGPASRRKLRKRARGKLVPKQSTRGTRNSPAASSYSPPITGLFLQL